MPKTTFYDFAEYTCSASNSVGEKVVTYTLRGQPSIAKYVAEKQTNLKNITLIWEIESEIPIMEHEILYKKKGVSFNHFIIKFRICLWYFFFYRQMIG